jgi:hypothetical protein
MDKTQFVVIETSFSWLKIDGILWMKTVCSSSRFNGIFMLRIEWTFGTAVKLGFEQFVKILKPWK